MKESRNKSLDQWSEEYPPGNYDSFSVALNMIDQVGSVFAVGPFYYYVVDAQNLKLLYVSEGIRNVLGIPPSNFSLELLYDIIHPEDFPTLEKLIELINMFYSQSKEEIEISSYKVSYLIRLKNSDGQYRTILNQSKIFGETVKLNQGKIINIHTDISYLKARQDYRISFTCKDKPSYHFDLKSKKFKIAEKSTGNLSERELQILKLTALGKKAEEIAKSLFISVNTVNTHKRNIINKYKCRNMPQLIADFLRKGVI